MIARACISNSPEYVFVGPSSLVFVDRDLSNLSRVIFSDEKLLKSTPLVVEMKLCLTQEIMN